MMENRIGSKNGSLPVDNERLSVLLRQWRAVEPQADFETVVWRKIRTVSKAECRRGPEAGRSPGWLTVRPIWATGIAAAAAVIMGIGMGFLSQRTFSIHPTTHPLLQSRTVAGAYLSVAMGKSR